MCYGEIALGMRSKEMCYARQIIKSLEHVFHSADMQGYEGTIWQSQDKSPIVQCMQYGHVQFHNLT